MQFRRSCWLPTVGRLKIYILISFHRKMNRNESCTCYIYKTENTLYKIPTPSVGPICYTEEMFLYILFTGCICVLIKDVYKYLNMFVLRSYMRFKNATMED